MIVGLVMIVRNEEAIVARAIKSALPFINTWLIVDTGSTDSTKAVIREAVGSLPGEIIDRPWQDFGTNRTELLRLADSRMDWAIMLDADDNFAGTPPPPSLWDNDELDAIALRVQHGQIWHRRIHIFRTGAGRDWAYHGVIHEQPVCLGKKRPVIGMLPSDSYLVTRCEGFRSRNPNKYADDAALLERELSRTPGDSRTLFYLAQSYRDAGMRSAAAANYRRYLELPDGPEGAPTAQERYIALMNLIQLIDDPTEQLALAWRAVELAPNRCEVPFSLLRAHRLAGRPPSQQLFALGAVVFNRMVDPAMMYVNPAIYEWGLDDELAIVAFATRHYAEARAASLRCAFNAPVTEMRINALNNARLAEERLAATASSASPPANSSGE